MVSDLASSITYHANAMPYIVTHGNGVPSTFVKDDFDLPRPKSIATPSVPGMTSVPGMMI